jgi:hypothetical protein
MCFDGLAFKGSTYTGLAAPAARRQPKNRRDSDKTGDAGVSRGKAPAIHALRAQAAARRAWRIGVAAAAYRRM